MCVCGGAQAHVSKQIYCIISQEHNLYRYFFNSKELPILLQFVDLTCFGYFSICAILYTLIVDVLQLSWASG